MLALFDNDGTLYDTRSVSIPAVQEAFEELRGRGWEVEIPSPDRITAAFGLPLPEYGEVLLPEAYRGRAMEMVELAHEGEARRLGRGEGALFDGIRALLSGLRAAGWKLALVSNCDRRYLSLIWNTFGYSEYFDESICHGDFPEDGKAGLVRRLLAGEGACGRAARTAGRMFMVGDRRHDMHAGLSNGLQAVYCAYGFGKPGEAEGAHHVVHDARDLAGVLLGDST